MDDFLTTDPELAELDRRYLETHEQFRIVIGYQTEGANAEGRGDIEGAIAAYTKAVDAGRSFEYVGVNNYIHDLDRLMILLRREKRYNEEIAVINAAIEDVMASDLPPKRRLLFEYEKRLNRAKELLDKSRQ